MVVRVNLDRNVDYEGGIEFMDGHGQKYKIKILGIVENSLLTTYLNYCKEVINNLYFNKC